MAQTSVSGSCLCKGIAYTITGTDKGAVLCHCSNCRKSSGSAFLHNTRLINATVKFNTGAELVKTYDDGDTKSGTHLLRKFCSNCGCPLYLESAGVKGLIVAQCGTLDDEDMRKPKFELFEADRRQWLDKVNKSKI